jgi:predicted Fe-S protein YdhL (DUF1289 family)
MDAVTGLCEGCFRTLDEIARWGGAGEDEKRAILEFIAKRRHHGEDPWHGMQRCDCE